MAEKRKFQTVEIPLLNKEIELLGIGKDDFEGRFIKIDLTNTLKGKGLEIKFNIKEEKEKITATPINAYLQGFYIRRVMRKGTDYVEDSFLVNCKDHRIRIKPFLITRKRVSRKVLNGLREKAKIELIKYVKDKTFDHIVLDIMNNKLQKEISPKLKKIYPLGMCEIKFIGIEDLKEHEKYEEEQKAEKEKKVEEMEKKEKSESVETQKDKPTEDNDKEKDKVDAIDSNKKEEKEK